MFFNHHFITHQTETRVSPQINFRLPNSPVLFGTKIYLPAQIIQPQFFTAPLQQHQQSPQKNGWEVAAEILCAIGLGVIVGGALILTATAIAELLGPRRNTAPLTAAQRRFIRERDGEICFYCGDYAPDGHVDHRTSRVNGGGNEPENLTWTCVFHNCSKGSMNDADYLALLEAYC